MDRTFMTLPGKFGVITSLLERPSLADSETAPHTHWQLKLPGLGRAGHRPHRQEPCWYCGPGALHCHWPCQTQCASLCPRSAIAGASSGSDSLRRRASVEPDQRKGGGRRRRGAGMAPSLACQCGVDPERRLADAPTCQQRSPRLTGRVHPRSGARSRDDGHRRRLRHVPRGLGQRLGRPLGPSVGPACRRRVDSEKPQPPRTGIKRP
jgi:hypothetical protein